MKKSRVFDRYGRVAAIDSKYTGDEPKWEGCESWDVTKFMKTRTRMLDFYNYYCTSKDLFDDLLKWMSKNGYNKDAVSHVKAEGEQAISFVTMKLARAMNMGMLPTRDDVMEYVKAHPGISMKEPHNDEKFVRSVIDPIVKRRAALKASVAQAKEDAPTQSLSPLERLSNKVNATILSELEAMIEDKGWTEKKIKVEGLNLTSLLKANAIPVKGTKEIFDWLEKYRVSLQNALDKENEFDVEGWAFTSKAGVKNRLKVITDMILQLEKYSVVNKTVRKPRKKKVKTADMQVKHLKYKESDEDFGIQSVSPLSVPGARKVIVFNTKYRKLTVYEADDPITVKGTTLQGWNPEKSYIMTVRKPEDILPAIANKTERQFTKLIDALKTKRATPNGRINQETIILRAL